MNALCYKIVFSKRLGALVAVGEHTSGQGKAAGTGVRTAVYPSSAVGATGGEFVGSLKAVFASVALTCFTATTIAAGPAANTLPTGYSVNSGNVAVSTSGADMTIKQTTDKASVNWQSFSIGSAASVNIQQNSASSVLLNRVVGNDPSQIFGKLTANGQVILINPNGIVFGKGGSVTASAFTASTFGMTDADFLAGKHKFSRNGSTAGVTVENGANINTTGYVALIGASVDNQGAITTKEGAVVLAAGESVALPAAMTDSVGIPLSSKVRLELAPSTINASVENGGTITTEGGQVLMQAAALSDAVASITHTGTIDTTGEQGGAVTLQADHGNIKATGKIKANSKNAKNKGGDIIIGRDEETNILAKATNVSGAKLESKGGFVETSGDELKFDGVSVAAKDWLLDPFNVNIDAASAATIGSNLATTSITIETTTGSSPGVNTVGTGNITISSAITKAGGTGAETTLTLLADNGIDVNAAIGTATGAGKLNVVMTAKGQTNGKAVADMSSAERALSSGIRINSSINANGGDVTLTGTSYANGPNQRTAVGKGVHIHNSSSINARNITITGTAENLSGNTSYGVVFQRFPNQATLNATGDIEINGTLKGPGNGSAVFFQTSGWGAQAPMITAGGKFSINAKNQTPTTNTSAALDVLSGMQVTAKGDIKISAETNTVAANAINISSNGSSVWGNALYGNTSLRSIDSSGAASGNILIQANQGGINLNNGITPTLTSGSLTAKTDIVGKNISIDNTGGSINLSTGAISQGNGKATGTGINMNDTRAITASGNVNIMGASSGAGSGVATKATMTASGDVNVTGESVNGNAVITYGAINATGGDVKITGASTGSLNTASALRIQGAITAQNNVTLTGSTTNASNPAVVAYLNKTVTATTGKIDISTSTAGTTANALQLAAGANLSAMTEVNIKADTLSIDTSNASIKAGASIPTAPTGTVSIKTDSTAAKIDINAGNSNTGDVGSATLTSRTLGLSNTELNRITAGNLIIGDTNNTGGITVSAVTTTNATTGNVTLQTGGNIAVNAGLTVGNASATNTLTLNGAGATSAITQALTPGAAIKAAGLELLGANATFTLTNSGNDIKKLAGNTGTVSLTNNQTFAIDTVNTRVGLTTTGNTTLNSTAAVTQTQAVNAAGLELLGAGGSYTLNNANNTVQKLAGNTGSVSLTNKGDLEISTVNTNGLTATGNVSITTTAGTGGQAGNLTLKKNITTAANVNLNAAGAVLRDAAVATDGNIRASLLRIKAGAGIGTSLSRIKTEVATLSMESVGDQHVTEANAVTVAAKSTGGSVNIDVTTEALTVGSSTLIDGISNTTAIDGVSAAKGVVLTAQAGDLNINQAISNTESGNVVLGAGVSKDAGDGTDGDVKTTTGMVVDNADRNTYFYTGSTAGTGNLNNLMGSLATLYLSKVGNESQNAQLNTAYNNGTSTSTSGAKAQVMFREDTKFDAIEIKPVTLTKTIGQVDPTSAVFSAALTAANSNGAELKKSDITNNIFKISTDAAGITGTLPSPGNQARTVGTYNYENLKTSGIATTVRSTNSGSPAAKLVVQSTNVIPVPTPVTPSTNTAKVKIPVGSANPFALASAEDLADDTCSANSVENCYCEESAVSKGVDICYEPKTAAKGSVR